MPCGLFKTQIGFRRLAVMEIRVIHRPWAIGNHLCLFPNFAAGIMLIHELPWELPWNEAAGFPSAGYDPISLVDCYPWRRGRADLGLFCLPAKAQGPHEPGVATPSVAGKSWPHHRRHRD